MTPREQTAAALGVIARVSGQRVDPPTLMPAEIILELSGEAVRSRLCTFTDATGQEFCLRPDLTTPIARQVASGDIPATRYHCAGPVYRLPPFGSNEAVEHVQVGFEWFGMAGSPDEDAEALAVALEAAKAGGATKAIVRFGDVAIYHAVIDALPFSPQWRGRLRRAFSRRKGPRELLANISNETTSPLAARIAAMPLAEGVKAVEGMIADLGVQTVGARGADDIAERLRDRAGDITPDTRIAAALMKYMDINAPVGSCAAAVEAFARDAKLDIAPTLEAFRKRLDRIAALKSPFWADATFSAEAGRRFEYYDGFVFELVRESALDRPLVSGGRYDGLIKRLSGGKRTASAIGAALRVDRLEQRGAA
ncbi:MAG: ATP phosphoribosyltransferase regulatory subunit [Hyphomonadaceae bacterium]|nr:ATP phosphoribosyltransferase regulatory subunit [Hyphomonadaceae bacterium]